MKNPSRQSFAASIYLGKSPAIIIDEFSCDGPATTPKGLVIYTKVDLRLSQSKMTRIFWPFCVTLNAIRYERTFANTPRTGNTAALGERKAGTQISKKYYLLGRYLDHAPGLLTSMRPSRKVSLKQFVGVSFAVQPMVPRLGQHNLRPDFN